MKKLILTISVLFVSSYSQIIESPIKKKSAFLGNVYFENKHDKLEVDHFGGNLKELAGENSKLIEYVQEYRSNQILFTSFYVSGLALIVAAAPVALNNPNSDAIFLSMMGVGALTAGVGIHFSVNADNLLSDFAFEFNGLTFN